MTKLFWHRLVEMTPEQVGALAAVDRLDVAVMVRLAVDGKAPADRVTSRSRLARRSIEGQVGPPIARRIRADYALRIDMTKPKPKDQLQKRGRKSLFRPEYILVAKAAARFGAIEEEIADELNIGITTLERWKQKYPEFRGALNAGKQAADERVERSLYQRANGYSHPAVKVFMTRDGKTVEHKYIEHYPPDPTSMCFWLKNRRPDRWRDVQNIDHAVGVYHISEAPLTEEEWIEHTSNGKQIDLEAKAIEHDANERKSNS